MSLLNYLFLHHKLGIRRKDIVIEVGSGGDPFLRSDILVERYIDDDAERHSALVIDRATIVADGRMLPFIDKSIDYIFCSHVLEHIPDPKNFLDELSRVGKRGLIMTPHIGYEKLHPKRGHLWYVWNEEGTLYFRQKKSWNEFPQFQEYYRRITRLPGYWRFWDKNYSFFNTILEWENKITYNIEQDEEFIFSNFTKASENTTNLTFQRNILTSHKQRVKSLLARVVRLLISSHWNINLNDVVYCPLCRGGVSYMKCDDTSAQCKKCGATFPIKQGIAYLIKEDAT